VASTPVAPISSSSPPLRQRTEEEPRPVSLLVKPEASAPEVVAPSRTVAAPSLTNRPVLKQRQAVDSPRPKVLADQGSSTSEAPGAAQGNGQRLVERPRPTINREEPSAAASDLVTPSQPPRILRPKPVVQRTTQDAQSAPERRMPDRSQKQPLQSLVEAVPSSTELELKRPVPPRVGNKRAKDWDDEVDETPDFKASKAATKTKRRVQPLEDEIEDIEDIDVDVNESEALDNRFGESSRAPSAAVQVSLSIARPPKAKKTPATPAKSLAASIPKARKSSDSSRSRRERREAEPVEQRPEVLVLTGNMTVQELAAALMVPESTIIKTLFFKGIAANINQALDEDTIGMVAEELGVLVEQPKQESEARKVDMLDEADLEKLQRRPPVVTIMGHVDHGKTTLLDSIRKTKVAQGEAGGITQHIGAYHVDVEQEGKIQQVVFLDTPGHEAFTAMRARGARVTDIAILVVAADDGVQPQTVEAISHAKAAEVPIVVAINKVDKPDSQPDRVKQELTEHGLVSEEWGGETVMVPVSAMTGENLDLLLEMILLVAEVEDLYANPERTAKGTIIEAHLDKAKGAVATLLVQNGTLRVGDILVAGSVLGKVRAMVDDRLQRVEEGLPSFAVEVLGLGGVPAAGDEFEVFKDEKQARAIAEARADQQRQTRLQQALSSRRVTLNSLSARAQEGALKELNLIVKADVQGSLEAIINALNQLPQNQVQLRLLFAAPGEITETDVDLAAASDAVILGFNTTLASGARQTADQTGVDIREYNIIYKLLDDVQGAMEGLLEPELVEEPLGHAEVRAIFPVGRGSVAGCYIQSGKVIRNCKVRVLRAGQVIHEGALDSLKRMKEDAREVNSGYECGLGVDSFNAWELGDVIEAYRMVAKRRTLTPD
jgi:translation initiation factor IF-2